MTESFPRRNRAYFERGLQLLGERNLPKGTERYGFLIDDNGPKGAVLAISSLHGAPFAQQLFINMSTWCVMPTHRGAQAKSLFQTACARDDAVNTDLSAAAHTQNTLDKFGFRPWTKGQFFAVACHGVQKTANLITTDNALTLGLESYHADVLEDHQTLGCLAVCLEANGRIMPLIFLRRFIKPGIPVAQLIYCSDVQFLLDHSAPVLKWLRRHARAGLILDADTAPSNLIGKYFAGRAAKYTRGLEPAMDIDHSYSEMVYLGF